MNVVGAALFSQDGRYRYRLERRWDDGRALLAIGLNGSKADAERSDNTITRLVRLAQGWGYGTLHMGNLFGLMSTDPKALYAATDPVGPETDAWLRWMAERADDVLVCWGSFPRFQWRAAQVLRLLGNRPLWCLGRTLSGAPRHPARLGGDIQRELWRPARLAA